MNPSVILYPVDPSGLQAAALEQAAALARWHQAELHVLFPTAKQQLDQRTLASLDAAGLQLVVNALAAPSIPAIVEYAQTVAADLLVVAAPPRRYGIRWRRVVDADALIGMIECPMMVVPADAAGVPRTSFTRILCPTDLPVGLGSAFREALGLAQLSGGRITLLHALEGFPYQPVYSSGGAMQVVREYRERVAQTSRRLLRSVPGDALNWCEVKVKVMAGAAQRAILDTAEAIDADLIVVGAAKPGSQRRLSRSATTAVLQRASCPVLVVPHSPYVGSEAAAEVTMMDQRLEGWRTGVPA